MTHPRPVTLLERERLERGELSADEAANVRARMEATGIDPFDGLPSDADVFADDTPDAVTREVRRRIAQSEWDDRPTPTRWRWVGTLVAACMVFLVIGRATAPITPMDDGIRLKGDAELMLYRQTPRGAERLLDGATAQEGDVVQIAVQAGKATHGLIFSVDGRGTVTEHLTFSGKEPAGEVVVESAYELDDAPKFEVFHVVLSRKAFEAKAVLASARRGGATLDPPLVPVGADHISLTLHKDD